VGTGTGVGGPGGNIPIDLTPNPGVPPGHEGAPQDGQAGASKPAPVDARRRAVRRTALLWAVIAFVAWNAIFDRIIVVSGRRYIRDAVGADAGGSYLLLNESMRPAVAQAFWAATAVGSAIGAAGVVAVRRKKRHFRAHLSSSSM